MQNATNINYFTCVEVISYFSGFSRNQECLRRGRNGMKIEWNMSLNKCSFNSFFTNITLKSVLTVYLVHFLWWRTFFLYQLLFLLPNYNTFKFFSTKLFWSNFCCKWAAIARQHFWEGFPKSFIFCGVDRKRIFKFLNEFEDLKEDERHVEGPLAWGKKRVNGLHP